MTMRLLSALQRQGAQHKTSGGRCMTLYQTPSRRRRGPWAARAATPAPLPQTNQEAMLTFEEVQQVAAARGLTLQLKTLGPFYRFVCRDGDERGKILGVTSGFLVPALGLMHCDTLQIFTKGIKGEDGDRVRGGPLGLGLLIGAATFAYGLASGCRKAEILAINDDDATHARLVKYYQRFGFVPVHVVTGDTLADLPHMLVWGGVGTRLDADVPYMLSLWAEAFRKTWSRGRSAAPAMGSASAGAGDATAEQ